MVQISLSHNYDRIFFFFTGLFLTFESLLWKLFFGNILPSPRLLRPWNEQRGCLSMHLMLHILVGLDCIHTSRPHQIITGIFGASLFKYNRFMFWLSSSSQLLETTTEFTQAHVIYCIYQGGQSWPHSSIVQDHKSRIRVLNSGSKSNSSSIVYIRRLFDPWTLQPKLLKYPPLFHIVLNINQMALFQFADYESHI